MGGHGYILDEEYRILYGVEPNLLLSDYRSLGNIPESNQFFEEVGGLGTRQMVYFQTMEGKGWSVVLSVPAERAQEIALGIAVPIAGDSGCAGSGGVYCAAGQLAIGGPIHEDFIQ